MLLQFFLDILDVTSQNARLVDAFPVLDFKLSVLPMGSDFVIELFLQLELFVS